MIAYAVRRLLHGIPTILGVTLLTFLIFGVVAPDPAVQYLGKNASAADVEALRRTHGFDRPIAIQYLDYLRQIASFDFGTSFSSGEPVRELILRGAGPSLSLTIPALIATAFFALLAGLAAARFRGRPFDRAVMAAAVAGMSASILLYIVGGQYLFAFELPLFPIHGYRGGAVERWPYLALPIAILVAVGLGYEARHYRAVLSEEIAKPHVAAARAKGLSELRVLGAHVLACASVPISARVMTSVPFLVTGSLLLESFFGIPGLGFTLLDALDHSDFPVIRAYTVLLSIVFVATNAATDLVYAALDPRVRAR